MEIRSPKCEFKRDSHFPLDTILDTFEIPDFQRVLAETHKTQIVNAIMNNDFYDNIIQVYDLKNGKRKYGVANGQHRLMALHLINQQFGLKEYELILQIFPFDMARQVFFRYNLGKKVTLSNITKALDDGTVKLFNEFRGDYEHKSSKKCTSFHNLIHAIRYAKTNSPRPLPVYQIEHFLQGISKSDIVYIRKFTRCVTTVSPFVANSFTYRMPVFRALFRVGWDNDLTDKNFEKIIQSTLDSTQAKDIVKDEGNKIECISYIYQYITNVLCDKINIPVNKPESIEYVRRTK